MIKYKKINTLVSLVITIFFCSCMEEIGNYTYHEINEVDIKGIQKEYSFLMLNNFNIIPELTFSQDSTCCSYKWEAIQRNNIGGDRVTLISTDRNLTERISLRPGTYNVFYTVKDTITGVETQAGFKLNITTSVYEGWLLLNDNESGPRLDMISKIENEYTTMFDVTEGSGLKLSGTPKYVYTYPALPSYHGIYVSTSDNGTVKLDPNDFSWNEKNNLSSEFVINQPIDLEADGIVGSNQFWGYVNVDGDIYHYYKAAAKYYSSTVNHINNEYFEASTIMVAENVWGFAIFYDNTNKRFVRNDQSTGRTTIMPNPPVATRKFDYTTGKDLVFMTNNNYTNTWVGSVFAILNDPVDNKNYLAFFVNWSGEQKYYGEIEAIDFDKATSYAVSPNYGYLFYAVGNKVYQYDFNNKMNTQMLDLGPRQISLIKFENFLAYGNKYESMKNKLVVCSYNPEEPDGSNGTFEIYHVPEVNGQIELEESYSGFGKIISIDYRER